VPTPGSIPFQSKAIGFPSEPARRSHVREQKVDSFAELDEAMGRLSLFNPSVLGTCIAGYREMTVAVVAATHKRFNNVPNPSAFTIRALLFKALSIR